MDTFDCVKGIVQPKIKRLSFVFTLVLLQTCMNDFLLWNTKQKDIFRIFDYQTVTIDFHYMVNKHGDIQNIFFCFNFQFKLCMLYVYFIFWFISINEPFLLVLMFHKNNNTCFR